MKRIVTIIGARPQFIKAAVLSRLIREKYDREVEEILVHTGQHYDDNMSAIFFREMMIPEPDINLNIGSGTHGKMTGRMLEKIEEVLLEYKPDQVLVYGDTNSTLAGALAAGKLHIPVAHVEAGLRSFDMDMPEEQNRILTDHLAAALFCPTDTAITNLTREGITKGVVKTGDIMLDASLFYRSLGKQTLDEVPDDFMLITLHRAENTDNPERLRAIVAALNEKNNRPGILPLHPRTAKYLEKEGLKFAGHIRVLKPVGFFDMLYLEEKCSVVVTDSGGVQKEAYFFRKPCITLRDQTEWVETVAAGWNTIVGADRERIGRALRDIRVPDSYPNLYGDGRTGETILKYLLTGNDNE